VGAQLVVEVENFYVQFTNKTCKIWAFAAAEQQQQYIQTYLY